MQPETLKDLKQLADDQITNLRAVKGDGFAQVVSALITARSTALVVSGALHGDTAPIAAMLMIGLQKEYLELLARSLGVKDDPELYEWADRIYDSVERAANAATATKGPSDSLH